MKTPQAIVRADMDHEGPGQWSASFKAGNGWTASLTIEHEGRGVYIVTLSKQQDDPIAYSHDVVFYRECKDDGIGAAMYEALVLIPTYYRKRAA